ncbi:dephospho-CoA kinase [Flavobacteriaceae bacterium TP-CH-4]|uniref:Dephospho-CoA kinase n=1 Tax=Pelagihabitans pacificus TaxID=2696054 RepID=A0A967EDG0_9FLAO|nr:dephospho-CoA kinase [Pelagihabitans pacificus]NHF59298.1 dephospho-CoA kinase [Pelagihabitans pacificus]
MKLVGLTGGIGSGKTTVAKMFADLGVPVYDSDKEAKRLMRSSKKVKKAIIELFGEQAYKNEKLNKKYLSNQVFNNGEMLKKLNAIVHPAVRKHFLEWAVKQKAPYVIQETALIFENQMQDFYDSVILVIAPQDTRLQRVMNRDGSSKEAIRARMKHQRSDVEKIALADYVIENLEIETTKQKVSAINLTLLENNGR